MKPLQPEFTGKKPTNTDQYLSYSWNALMNGWQPAGPASGSESRDEGLGVLRGSWGTEKMEKGPLAELTGPKGAEKRLWSERVDVKGKRRTRRPGGESEGLKRMSTQLASWWRHHVQKRQVVDAHGHGRLALVFALLRTGAPSPLTVLSAN